jgi:uncharacterized membrane protein YfcA
MTAGLTLDGSNLLVAGAALLGAFASGLAGFAFGLVALGLWLHVLSPKIAGPLVVVASLVVQTVSLIHLRRAVRLDLLWPFVVGGLIGVPVGVWLLDYTDPDLFRRSVGAFLALYAAYMLLAPAMAPMTAGGRAADTGVGFIGGVMSGLAGLSGAVPTAWCRLRGWSKDVTRAVYQPFNMAIQVMSIAALFQAGLLTRELGFYTLLCLPAMLIGVWLGLRLYARVDERQFRKIVLGMLLVSGISLIL